VTGARRRREGILPGITKGIYSQTTIWMGEKRYEKERERRWDKNWNRWKKKIPWDKES